MNIGPCKETNMARMQLALAFLLVIIPTLICGTPFSSIDPTQYGATRGTQEDSFTAGARSVIHERADDTIPVVPGMDFLGFSLDITLGPIEQSLKVGLFNWTYDDQALYYYPPKAYTFRVPDSVFSRTVSDMKSGVMIHEKWEDYSTTLQLNAGISVQASKSSTSPTTGGVDTNTMKSALTNGMFSGDAKVAYIKSEMQNNKMMLVTNTLHEELWQLILSPDMLLRSKPFAAMKDINSESDPAVRRIKIMKFLNKYGTHYIEAVIMGGSLAMNSLVTSQTNTNTTSTAASLSFAAAFGLSNKVAATVDVAGNLSNVVSSFEQNSTRDMEVIGGNPDTTNFFSGADDLATTYEDWRQSLHLNPSPVRYRLREISWLFDRPDFATDMRKQVRTYMIAYIDNLGVLPDDI